MDGRDRATLGDRVRGGANLLLALTQVLAAPLLSAAGIGEDIGARSAQSPALFTPPGFSFAIWGPIYLAMIMYGLHSVLPSRLADPRLRRIGWWTAAAMLCNTLWPVVTVIHGVVLATVLIIALMLAALLRAFFGLYRDGRPQGRETLSVVFPVSIFAAWITVATVANTASWLGNGGGFDGGPVPDGLWVAALGVIAGALAALAIRTNGGNGFYAAVLVWALGGVAYKMFVRGETAALSGLLVGLALVIGAYLATRGRARGPARQG